MKALVRILESLWDFVVGDDWITAAGVVVALAITALLARSTSSVWWIMPVAVIVLLSLYVWRSARHHARRSEDGGIRR